MIDQEQMQTFIRALAIDSSPAGLIIHSATDHVSWPEGMPRGQILEVERGTDPTQGISVLFSCVENQEWLYISVTDMVPAWLFQQLHLMATQGHLDAIASVPGDSREAVWPSASKLIIGIQVEALEETQKHTPNFLSCFGPILR